MSERTLKDRVSDRLLELGINAFEASRRGGLGREFVNDILRGRKQTVRGDNLQKLASALEVSAEYLLGLSPESYISTEYPKILDDVVFGGVIAEDVWRSASKQSNSDILAYYEQNPPDGRFPAADQIDFALDESAPGTPLQKNMLLRCIRADRWGPAYPTPQFFVVERQQGNLVERTVQGLSPGDRGPGFAIGRDDRGNSTVAAILYPTDDEARLGQRTVGVVLYAYHPLLPRAKSSSSD